jgi:uncharacterized small protein (DUF1192 family)
MASDIDDIFGAPPRKAEAPHVLGQSLEALSVRELEERIELLAKEMERLEQAKKLKLSSLQAASAFFKI